MRNHSAAIRTAELIDHYRSLSDRDGGRFDDYTGRIMFVRSGDDNRATPESRPGAVCETDTGRPHPQAATGGWQYRGMTEWVDSLPVPVFVVAHTDYSDYSGSTVDRANFEWLRENYPRITFDAGTDTHGHTVAAITLDSDAVRWFHNQVYAYLNHNPRAVGRTPYPTPSDLLDYMAGRPGDRYATRAYLARMVADLSDYPLFDDESHSDLEMRLVEEGVDEGYLGEAVWDRVETLLGELADPHGGNNSALRDRWDDGDYPSGLESGDGNAHHAWLTATVYGNGEADMLAGLADYQLGRCEDAVGAIVWDDDVVELIAREYIRQNLPTVGEL